jgi:hypothetical protein
MDERDLRLALLNTLLTTPHRNLAALYPLHHDMIGQDPRFYVRLAAWYSDRGDVRDHKEMFVVNLCLSHFEGHRDVGLALLGRLPPYEVGRVIDFIKGRTFNRPAPRTPASRRDQPADAAKPEPVIEKVGLFKNVPRSVRTEVEHYLREREVDPGRLDQTILHARKALKRLYAVLHIPPSPRAQAILFDDEPPADSLLHAVRQIAKCVSPAEQASAIAAHRIPYRVAASLVREMTPEVLKALVGVMSPQEVINNVSSLKERGAFDDKEVKALIEAKLEAAKGDQRVSAFKAKVAAEASGASGALAGQLEAVTEARVKAKGRIRRPTALLIDKSASMHEALEVGRQLGAMVSAICDGDLFAYAFDSAARQLHVQDGSLAGWEKALAGVWAGGATACGAGLEALRQNRQRVEQIILVTDENENRAPRFQESYMAYGEELAVRPAVILLKVGQAGMDLERACAALGVAPSLFEFRGDYYALTNLIPLLTQPSMLELLMEIMEYPLPQRRRAATV